MIEKMRFITITGPKAEFDRVVGVYLNKYEIHLENALSELSSVQDLKPFVETNPYKDVYSKALELAERFDKKQPAKAINMTLSEASTIILSASREMEDLTSQKKKLGVEREHLLELQKRIEPFRPLDYEIDKILAFKFIKYRFGRISTEYYTKFSKFVYESLTTMFIECGKDTDYVWGVYFVPEAEAEKTDTIFSSLHFENISLTSEYEGTPEQVYNSIIKKLEDNQKAIDSLNEEMKNRLSSRSEQILNAYETICVYSNNFDVRKVAACTTVSKRNAFYFILCGWIAEDSIEELLRDIDKDKNIYCMTEKDISNIKTKPPTKLRNLKIFRPFEMFIKMYGLPAYNEIDPTFFVAITYSIIFGIMFGDVGQGLCLAIGGCLLYYFKKIPLAAIIATAGIFSTIMGFMYGSIFGFEDILPHIWLNPMENVMTVLLIAVAFGSGLIIIAMVINIINGIKMKDVEKIFFDTNGVAGLVFYVMVLVCVVLVATGNPMPAGIVLLVFLGIPLILIFLREPLSHLVEKKAEILPEQKGMFFLESFFELFEIVLSYLTNSISFLRVGAFAISHAAMMGVVMLFAGAHSGNPNILVVIIGNIFVAGMEGLIVGIQVLRLEYYEMFSRFYSGTGKGFKPYKSK
ncbi:V/A-type H+-transporting ATPase subunit I [Anaerocolumna jejuensis DSM 15929]|uniref:V/A-type H+-transporting ATPase subunit I n=1 Tax=Anaerocolumna jejuensis DSM 15929 TaxID=1121322 RepID=A0A1M6RNL3_9FIRM|nr:V-type ATPase 116kDa subunit family protein [Anaerocolumna jejuensis]SHK33980.1 V/A-type H+-transporting ATPase subunit I [Anaerocolumna jejuensis DSM 15929]